MTKLKSIVLAVIVAMAFVGCNGPVENTTASGVKYRYITNGGSDAASDAKFLMVNMVYADDNDSVWADTRNSGLSVPIPKPDSASIDQWTSVEQVFAVLQAGDSVEFALAKTKFFRELPGGQVPPGIDTVGNFNFKIGVEDVFTGVEAGLWQIEANAKSRKEQMEKDIAIIDDYLEKNNIKAEKTESGLRYVITQEGSGEKAVSGDIVVVDYAGHQLEGPYFDTSIEEIAKEQGLYNPQRPYEPYDFKIDVSLVIVGWHEGLKQLNKGAKATLYVPSVMGYGQRGLGPIGSNSNLVFDIELVDIIE